MSKVIIGISPSGLPNTDNSVIEYMSGRLPAGPACFAREAVIKND